MFLIYMGLIAYASLASPSRIPRVIVFEHLDKVVHFVMYFGFCIMLIYAIDRRKYHDSGKTINNLPFVLYLMVLLAALTWGFAMELLQQYMSMGRQYSMYDMIANAAGALAGLVLYFAIFKKI